MSDSSTVEALIERVRDVLQTTLDRGSIGPMPSALLSEAIASARALEEQLVELQRFVVLETDHRDELDMQGARRLWESLEPGTHLTNLEGLVSASPTLSVLRRAAVDVESVHRFSAEEVVLASTIAEAAGPYTQYIGQISGRSATRRHDSFPIKLEAVDAVSRLLEVLTRAGAISGFSMSARADLRDQKPFWKPLQTVLSKKWRYDAVSVRRGEVSAAWKPFLDGHWLTAYAYGIALDQFERTGATFEIYSNVGYRLPTDLGGGKSDMDVLVRTADTLLCIECKSGRVLSQHPHSESAARKSLHAAERLDRLLSTMGVDLERTYQLVYLSFSDQGEKDVKAEVSGGAVPMTTMTPSRIRTTVRNVANGTPGA